MLRKGQVLQGQYRLQKQLRSHLARQTWLAEDCKAPQSQKKLVIIKFLNFGRGMQWDDWKLFEREVQILKQLCHPHIPKYLHAFHIKEPEAWLGLIEEYIPGPSVQTLIHQAYRFSEAEIYELAAQILEILLYLHGQHPPVLHRDIKPSNLILTPTYQIYLVDFGAVQGQDLRAGDSFTVVGTYGYTPMEQYGGQAVPASDLYSLGASLLHMLTGIAPATLMQPDLRFQWRDGLQSAYILRTETNDHRLYLSPPLATWLEKMTAPTLADRFESAQAALTALSPRISPPSPVLPASPQKPLRLDIDTESDALHLRIHPPWSAPLSRLQDVVGMAVLSILGPLIIGILGLFPLGMLFTQQALRSGNITDVSIGLLLLCFGGVPWVTGLYWLKHNLTSTSITLCDHHLAIKYQLFNWTYWQKVQSIAEIVDIYAISIGADDNTVMVSFTTQPPLQLAHKLNTQDNQALTQTLHHWLTPHPSWDRYC